MKKLITLVIPFALLVTGCGKKQPTASSTAPAAPAAATDLSKIQIAVTERGFEPESVDVPSGKPVTIVFTRKTDKTCAKEVVLTLEDGTKVEKQLPLDTPVELAATFPKAGKLGYACSMDMVKGMIVVR
jgi:plastocyanin domain-containing protein